MVRSDHLKCFKLQLEGELHLMVSFSSLKIFKQNLCSHLSGIVKWILQCVGQWWLTSSRASVRSAHVCVNARRHAQNAMRMQLPCMCPAPHACARTQAWPYACTTETRWIACQQKAHAQWNWTRATAHMPKEKALFLCNRIISCNWTIAYWIS